MGESVEKVKKSRGRRVKDRKSVKREGKEQEKESAREELEEQKKEREVKGDSE